MHGTTKFSSCSPPLVLQSALVIFGDSLVFAIITEEVGDICIVLWTDLYIENFQHTRKLQNDTGKFVCEIEDTKV